MGRGKRSWKIPHTGVRSALEETQRKNKLGPQPKLQMTSLAEFQCFIPQALLGKLKAFVGAESDAERQDVCQETKLERTSITKDLSFEVTWKSFGKKRPLCHGLTPENGDDAIRDGAHVPRRPVSSS